MEYQEIVEKKKRITESPVHPLPENVLDQVKNKFIETRSKSQQIYEEAKNLIPGGVQHNLSITNPFPLAMDKAKGYKIWDVDGNEYIDYLMCGGPIILGHHYDPLDNQMLELLKDKGPSTGLTSEYELLATKQIQKFIPSCELVRYFQSGTEANMAAARIARVFTKKKKIIKFDTHYHGWGDQLAIALHIVGTGPLKAGGIPPECYKNTLTVIPNDIDKLKKLFEDNKDKGGIAAVFMEGNGGEAGSHPIDPNWVKAIRELCDQYEALLVFDEVITGFRLAKGGAAEYYGVTPDLHILGKVLSHGYPSCGAVGGRKEVMNVCSAGVGGTMQSQAFVAGTLSGNHLTTAATYFALKLVDEENAIEKAGEYGTRLTKALNELFETRPDLPFFAFNYGSIIHYETTSFMAVELNKPDALMQIMNRKRIAEEYAVVINNMNINCMIGSRMYCCMQHDDYAFEQTLKAWEYLLSLIPKQ